MLIALKFYVTAQALFILIRLTRISHSPAKLEYRLKNFTINHLKINPITNTLGSDINLFAPFTNGAELTA
jgi:hypothetical protein